MRIFTRLFLVLAAVFVCLHPLHAQWAAAGLPGKTVTSLAVSGPNLVAGTWGGGTSISPDDGATWITTGLAAFNVTAFAVTGANLFAGTNGGVYRSSDDGGSWTAVNGGLTNSVVSAFAFSGANLFAGTDGGVFLSTNNGGTWTSVKNGLSNIYVKALAISGANLFAGTLRGVFLSTNNGATWVNVGMTLNSIYSLLVSGPYIIAGTDAGVYVTANNGASWTAIGLTGYNIMTLTTDGSRLFAGTYGGGVFLSTNTGASWTAVNNGLGNSDVRAFTVSGSNLFAGTYGGGVWAAPLSTMATIAIPVLSTPADGSINIPTATTLTWNAAVGALSYQLQVSTSSNFSGTIINQSGITSSLYELGGLSNNTVYYWRVNASNASGVSGWSTTRSFTTIAAAPTAPVLVSPADSAVGVAINPTLTWKIPSGAISYQLQVSTDTGFATTVVNQSGIVAPSFALSALVNNTTYYWRVNATNAGGTGPWSVRRNFTTIVTPPAAPVPVSPIDGAADVLIDHSIVWNASSGAASYQLQVSVSSSFATTVVNQSGITTASFAVTGLVNNTKYYWRVNAKNSAGTSAWSATRSYTTIVAAPAGPTLVSPANGAAGVAITPALSWIASIGAATYRVQLATDSSFAAIVVDRSGITTPTTVVNGLSNLVTYYWRVCAVNVGGTSAWSGKRSFTTIVATPDAPVMIFPADSATGIPTDPTLLWNASGGAVSYQLQIATTSNFSGIVLNLSGIIAASYAVSGLANNTLYYWRLNAANIAGAGAWSPTRTFTTVLSVPDKVTLMSPANGSSIGADSVHFVWHRSSSLVTSYEIELTGDSTVVKGSSDTTAAFKVPAGKTERAYTWRVRAKNGAGFGPFSNDWSFIRLTTSVPAFGSLPNEYIVDNNYPNPFNPSTTFSFSLPRRSFVRLQVFDAFGKEVSTVLCAELPAGRYARQWNADGLPSGMYFYRLQAGSFTDTKRLILLK